MPTPSLSCPYPVYGQAFNVSVCMKSPTTGNPITTALSGLVALVSIDDGDFALTTTFTLGTAPVARGTSGWVSLDLTPEMMAGRKIDVEIRATGAIYATLSIAPHDLRSETVRYDEESVWRMERMLLNLFDFIFNDNSIALSGYQAATNRDGVVFARGTTFNEETEAFRGKMKTQ